MKLKLNEDGTYSIEGLTKGKLHALLNVLQRSSAATVLQREVRDMLIIDITHSGNLNLN